MASAREYLRAKKDREQGELVEVESKIKRHRRRMIVRLGIAIAVVAVLGVLTYLVLSNAAFTKYIVAKEIDRTDDGSSLYHEFNGNIIRYSKDGVAYMDYDGNELWNQTYEMQNPVVDVNGSAAVIADRGGNHVFVFDAGGIQGEFETRLPVEKIRVSRQGLTAVLMKDENVNWIHYYDKNGVHISDNKTSMANSGYPLDFAVSPDGLKIMISYLHISNSTMTTKVAFYNFDSVGQEAIDNLVSAKTYEDVLVPTTQFISNDTAFAVGDDRVLIFKGKEIPEIHKEITFKEEIKSVFYSERYIGVVLSGDSSQDQCEMVVYSLGGDQVFRTAFSSDIKKVQFDNDHVVLYGASKMMVFNIKGKIQFEQNLEATIQTLIPISGFQKYAVVYESGIEHIKLRWEYPWSS